MNRRSFAGTLVLGALLITIPYMGQARNTSEKSSVSLVFNVQGGVRVILKAQEANPSQEDLNAAVRVIEDRLDAFGVAEPIVQIVGDDRVVVRLPNLSSADQDRVLDLISQQGVLEFRIVKPGATGPFTPEDLEPAAFTGEVLQDASTYFDPAGRVAVRFDIKWEFTGQFGDFTSSNIGRYLAIVLDNTIQSTPVINSRIEDQGQISGDFTLEEALDLALVLRSGSLPITLQIEEVRPVGR